MLTGELAASGTAILWAFSSLLFTLAGQRVGAEAVNVTRLYFGFVFICLLHAFMSEPILDFRVEVWRHEVLCISAFIGLVIGDGALFYAFVLIGPRLSMLIMSTVPAMTAGFSLICFNEHLNWIEWSAVIFAIAAIGYVVGENRVKGKSADYDSKQFSRGVVLALVGALGQTGNLVITKYALADDFSTLTATQIRILYSMLFLTVWALYRRNWLETLLKLRDPTSFWLIAGGALIGPFIGIWLSYIAIEYTKIAVASVIMATPPLLLIPISAIFLGEKISARSMIGTLLAFIGIAVLIAFRSES
ncbi:MAG: DMT family transporter [Planctomycetota bacterium]